MYGLKDDSCIHILSRKAEYVKPTYSASAQAILYSEQGLLDQDTLDTLNDSWGTSWSS